MKRLIISWAIDTDKLAALLANSADDMNIQVYGDDQPQRRNGKRLNGKNHKQKLLAAPAPQPEGKTKHRIPRGPSIRKETTNYDFIVKCLSDNQDKILTMAELVDLFEKDGRNPKSISAQINTLLRKQKRVKKTQDGAYQLIK